MLDLIAFVEQFQSLIGAGEEAHIEFKGALILGQNDAIVVHMTSGATSSATSVVRAFFE